MNSVIYWCPFVLYTLVLFFSFFHMPTHNFFKELKKSFITFIQKFKFLLCEASINISFDTECIYIFFFVFFHEVQASYMLSCIYEFHLYTSWSVFVACWPFLHMKQSSTIPILTIAFIFLGQAVVHHSAWSFPMGRAVPSCSQTSGQILWLGPASCRWGLPCFSW